MTERKKLTDFGLSGAKLAVSGALLAFSLVTFVLAMIAGDSKSASASIKTMLLIALPPVVGILMNFSLSLPVYTIFSLYATGPMMGYAYKLYYVTTWWDDVLHFTGGVVFAMFGGYLISQICKDVKLPLAVTAVFAICFSITVSAVWEFVEYGSDRILGTDMQRDTVIREINSYEIGESTGVLGSIGKINDVSVNGERLDVDGYLDIGLWDTMHDMMIEAFGALLYAVVMLADKERHPVFVRNKRESLCQADAKCA